MGRESQDFGSSVPTKKLKKNLQKTENNTQLTNTTTIIINNTKHSKNQIVKPSINTKLLFIDPATNTTSINTSIENSRSNPTQHISDDDFGTDNNNATHHNDCPTTTINGIQANVIVNNGKYPDNDMVELT
jgi:hypothetical protein